MSNLRIAMLDIHSVRLGIGDLSFAIFNPPINLLSYNRDRLIWNLELQHGQVLPHSIIPSDDCGQRTQEQLLSTSNNETYIRRIELQDR